MAFSFNSHKKENQKPNLQNCQCFIFYSKFAKSVMFHFLLQKDDPKKGWIILYSREVIYYLKSQTWRLRNYHHSSSSGYQFYRSSDVNYGTSSRRNYHSIGGKYKMEL
eukprot:TRINITY_DN25656_c0_g2_i1.p1 TRINITY_DN25656_c0_g2~~TRINITY_DN25656_c0_g2_i1.p1  ORF type:complete len:108 (+),score=10.30 TRINITY_DN25656_c0_g2_i1:267-590(+)